MGFIIAVSVTNERALGVSLHQRGKIPVWLPNATLVGGQKINLEPGDYAILLATQFGTAGREINCVAKGKKDSSHSEIHHVGDDGSLIAWFAFRVDDEGVVR